MYLPLLFLALNHFVSVPTRQVVVQQGDSLTLPCKKPYGVPEPSIFWLFRNVKETFVIESINNPHITGNIAKDLKQILYAYDYVLVDGEGSLQFSYVDLHDGRENLVYQCAATSPVLHGEYRAGDEFRLIVNPAGTGSTNMRSHRFHPLLAAVKPRPAKKLWFSPSVVKVVANEPLRLTCIFDG